MKMFMSTASPGESRARSEDQVLAESALLGERAVSLVRLGVLGAQLALFAPLEAKYGHADLGRIAIAGAYGLFALAIFLVLRRTQSDPRKAARAPTFFNFFDFGFLLAMSWPADVASVPEMARAAILGALMLSYSVARFRLAQVVQSVAFACAVYGTIAAHLHASATTTVFVMIGYCGLGTLIGWTNSRLRRIFVDVRRRDQLMRFLPPQVAQRALSLKEDALAPVQREVSVMFLDIRGFTSLSESMPPGEVLSFLESFFRPMSEAVRASGGVVNKFLGDGFLAIWGAPEADAQHAEHAVGAALELRLRVEQFNSARRAQNLPPVEIGMGIHSGWVAAGMLGSRISRSTR
jgi:adenylate cyclase